MVICLLFPDLLIFFRTTLIFFNWNTTLIMAPKWCNSNNNKNDILAIYGWRLRQQNMVHLKGTAYCLPPTIGNSDLIYFENDWWWFICNASLCHSMRCRWLIFNCLLVCLFSWYIMLLPCNFTVLGLILILNYCVVCVKFYLFFLCFERFTLGFLGFFHFLQHAGWIKSYAKLSLSVKRCLLGPVMSWQPLYLDPQWPWPR